MKIIIFLLINIFATINSQTAGPENEDQQGGVLDTISGVYTDFKNNAKPDIEYDYYANIEKYPGYDGVINVSGMVKITAEMSRNFINIRFECAYSGLPPNASGGWHVHTGESCSNASEVGGHLFTFGNSSFDPWIPVTYKSNGEGEASGVLNMSHFTEDQIKTRTIVVHAPDGQRVGCGEIQEVDFKYVAKKFYKEKVADYLPIVIVVGVFALLCCIGCCCYCRKRNASVYTNQD